jgi:LacI family transcriptional regulator
VAQPGGGRRGGLREVALAAGVSLSTVSNVLNNPQVVAEETRRRVEEAMVGVGFVRNRAARQLRGSPSTVVGGIVLDVSNPYFAELARGMEDRLAEDDCVLVLCSTDMDPERQARQLRTLEELGALGVVLSPAAGPLEPLVETTRRGTPVVLVDHPAGGLPLCAAAVDHEHGGALAAGQLLDAGHRRLAFVREAIDVHSTAARAEGARRAVGAAGLDPASALAEIRLQRHGSRGLIENAEEVVDELLALRPRPTGVLCFNDITAIGVMRGLGRRGVAVPERMSIVGYDDVSFAAQTSPPLTTVSQPAYELGRAAASLLLAEREPGHRHGERLFTPRLAARGSVAAPPPER